MDDGFVIPGLNEGWTLWGAKLMEWVSGVIMAMILQEVLQFNIARSGPLMLMIGACTVYMMAGARRAFPDEERGLRNCCMVACGFTPPGIPTPAAFRGYWSGAPMRSSPKTSYYSQLGLEGIFADIAKTDEPGSIFLKQNAA